ncbi:MAG: gluconate 2-dehydrogenase subunit 3 family protein, partial [Dehalococcoidia bacterium]
EKHRLAVEPPHDAPLDVPLGGGAAQTPYPAFDVASEDKWTYDWDEKTRRLVRERVENVPPYRFFPTDEAVLLEALCARVLPQEDRDPDQRIPIAPWIDARLHEGKGHGYRYADMPDDREAYRRGLEGLDQTARALFQSAFVELDWTRQDAVIRRVADGSPPGKAWKTLPAKRFFHEFMSDVVSTYYAHPAAWAEIGFNGPASPRGHMRLSLGKRDPWEAEERRPRSSVEIIRQARGRGAHAQGGPTH